jgi:hypothetical protein
VKMAAQIRGRLCLKLTGIMSVYGLQITEFIIGGAQPPTIAIKLTRLASAAHLYHARSDTQVSDPLNPLGHT